MKIIEKLNILKKNELLFVNLLYWIMPLVLIVPHYYLIMYNKSLMLFNSATIIMFYIVLLWAIKKRNISKFYFYIFVFFAPIIYSTMLNYGDMRAIVFFLMQLFILVNVFYFSLKRDQGQAINIYVKISYIYLIFSFITIFLFPNILGSEFYKMIKPEDTTFLTHRNGIIRIALPALCFSVLTKLVNNKKPSIIDCLIFLMTLASIIYKTSVTTIIVLLAMAILYVLYRENGVFFKKIINVYTMIIINLTFFFGVILFKIQHNFAWFFEKVLHRTATFTGRERIWDYVLEGVKSKPLLGNGLLQHDKMLVVTHNMTTSGHNFIVDCLFMGGITSLVFFFIVAIICQKRLLASKINAKSKYWILVCMFCISIDFLTSTYSPNSSLIGFIGVLFMAYHADLFTSGVNLEPNNEQ